jgi:hypothetical protein
MSIESPQKFLRSSRRERYGDRDDNPDRLLRAETIMQQKVALVRRCSPGRQTAHLAVGVDVA